jgi:hypothetical protein
LKGIGVGQNSQNAQGLGKIGIEIEGVGHNGKAHPLEESLSTGHMKCRGNKPNFSVRAKQRLNGLSLGHPRLAIG